MARTIGKLTALKVGRLEKPGMYPDGGGLYLQVSRAGAKSWLYRFVLAGKQRYMGLGSLVTVSLAAARDRAAEARKQCQAGIDPIGHRDAARAASELAAARGVTFHDCAAAYIEAHKAAWRNAKHRQQWENTIETYANPKLGTQPVGAIDTGLVLSVLEPIWTEKPETASRLRGRIEAVLDWAKARGYREGENPARWRGHLNALLPARGKVARVSQPRADHIYIATSILRLRLEGRTFVQALNEIGWAPRTVKATWKAHALDAIAALRIERQDWTPKERSIVERIARERGKSIAKLIGGAAT